MTILIPIIILVSLVGALVWRIKNHPSSLRERLDQWAQTNNLVITEARRRYLFAGPFSLERSGIVFKIKVRKSDGQTQVGWLRLGYDFFSRQPWSEKVIWDDKPAA